ncbi:methionine adenosyltransferase [Brevundimonas pishanensis]|uniref:methionine adenosyltransferase n=1 Tax=Brevundimonas pishanensis TaxID=2896315 RepID=UPI001FA773BA
MARSSFQFTSESVSEGHPDKVADQISDAIVDLFLSKDPEARVACETLTTTQLVVLAGEIRGKGIWENNGWVGNIEQEIEDTVRRVVREIGYEQDGFHWKDFTFQNNLHGQSADIAVGVDSTDTKDEGAGDQGIMFGYASNETPELMPATLAYSHSILKKLAGVRHAGGSILEPDAKAQVTLQYQDGKPVRATSIVVSTQHAVGKKDDVEGVVRPVVESILPADFITNETVWHINPTGIFEIGGPDGDTGLTGRKIIVDTYGGAAPHGGGAFSGKDPTKVDRSAAYAARYLAKNVVAAGLANRCTIQLSYAIGVAKPQSVHVDLHGTGKIDPEILEKELPAMIGGATPRSIREHLGLNKPIYERTAKYGHFGREPEVDGGFSWEKTDLVDKLKALVA